MNVHRLIFKGGSLTNRALSNLSEDQINLLLSNLIQYLIKDIEQVGFKKDALPDWVQSINGLINTHVPMGEVQEAQLLESGIEINKVTSIPLVIRFNYQPEVANNLYAIAMAFKLKSSCIFIKKNEIEPSDLQFLNWIQFFLNECQIEGGSVQLKSESSINQELLLGTSHIYLDQTGDLKKAKNIIFNQKTHDIKSELNVDTLLIHESRLTDASELVLPLLHHQAEIFADELTLNLLKDHYDDYFLKPLQEGSFLHPSREYKLSIKSVANDKEAIDHINQYGRGQAEALITEDEHKIDLFLDQLWVKALYVNLSTAFGFHRELVGDPYHIYSIDSFKTKPINGYKYLIKGSGHIY